MSGISHEILGARILSDKEIKMILPNYTQMIEEIIDIRSYEKKKNSAKKVRALKKYHHMKKSIINLIF